MFYPSLHSNSALDRDIKGAMVRDLLNLACFQLPDKKTFRPTFSNTNGNNTERRLNYSQLSADEKAKHLFYVQKHLDEVEICNTSIYICCTTYIRIYFAVKLSM